MRKFSDFGIKPEVKGLSGDKISIHRIINKEIEVQDFKLSDSKFEGGHSKCLHLQIVVDNAQRVVFTGSGVLMDQISKIPKDSFPFRATIMKEKDRYEFT